MKRQWLVIQLEAPLMAFGGVLIDQVGPTRDFPAASMLVGLIGNALGWEWSEQKGHQALQDRLIFASRRDWEGSVLTDAQNAKLEQSDKGWTTHGAPEGRDGGNQTYKAPHRRLREYHADLSVCIVMRLDPTAESPTIEQVASALDLPARPLYIGRKPCLPSKPLLADESSRWVTADTAYDALRAVPGYGRPLRALWPTEQGPEAGDDVDRIMDLADLRNWRSGFHSGSRRVVEGRVAPAVAAQ